MSHPFSSYITCDVVRIIENSHGLIRTRIPRDPSDCREIEGALRSNPWPPPPSSVITIDVPSHRLPPLTRLYAGRVQNNRSAYKFRQISVPDISTAGVGADRIQNVLFRLGAKGYSVDFQNEE